MERIPLSFSLSIEERWRAFERTAFFARVKLEQVRFEETRDATALLLSRTLSLPELSARCIYCGSTEKISQILLISASNSPLQLDLMPGCLHPFGRKEYFITLWNAWTRVSRMRRKFHTPASHVVYLEVKAGPVLIVRSHGPIFVRVTNNLIFHCTSSRVQDTSPFLYPDGWNDGKSSSKSGGGAISEGNRYVSVIKREGKTKPAL